MAPDTLQEGVRRADRPDDLMSGVLGLVGVRDSRPRHLGRWFDTGGPLSPKHFQLFVGCKLRRPLNGKDVEFDLFFCRKQVLVESERTDGALPKRKKSRLKQRQFICCNQPQIGVGDLFAFCSKRPALRQHISLTKTSVIP